jgi:hypothetical protein
MRRRLGSAVVLAVLALGGVNTGTAFANHRSCQAAGGFTLTNVGPTSADVCVLVSGSNGVMVGADVINNCTLTGGCTTVGAQADNLRATCVGAAFNDVTLLALCTI